MRQFFSKIRLPFALLLLLTLAYCGGDEPMAGGDGGNDGDGDGGNNGSMNPVDNRLPQAIIDQESYTASHMADTDGDGDVDIILGPANGPSADMLLINDGSGFFELKANAFPTRYQGSSGQTVNIIDGDFNEDGRIDILSSTIDGREATFSESAQIHLYLNNGDNTFTDASGQVADNLFPQGWIEWMRVGDLNKDGHLDFVTTGAGLGEEELAAEAFVGGYIYLNDGSANFSRATIQMNDNSSFGAYTSDLLVWDPSGNESERYLDRYALDIFVGDVDSDGDDDLVAPNGFADGRWPTFLNHSDGTDVSLEVIFNGNGNEDPFDEIRFKNGALIDIDHDGFLDVIGSGAIAPPGAVPEPIYAFINNGEGQFAEATGYITGTAPDLVHGRQWLVGDFDGNGEDDVFIADHGWDGMPFPGYPNTLLLSSLDGLTNSSGNVGSVAAFTHGGATGDIDGDGDIDLFLNNHQGLEGIPGGSTADFFIYLNDGSGRFTGTE